jgi:outer membrane lipoprotein SlyB
LQTDADQKRNSSNSFITVESKWQQKINIKTTKWIGGVGGWVVGGGFKEKIRKKPASTGDFTKHD